MSWNIIKHQIDGKCEKFLIQIDNKYIIEVGAICHNNYLHLCMPTQIGCPIHCLHCATTYSKVSFIGNIKFQELYNITEYFVTKYDGEAIILSFSGHGEPMLNWNNVFKVAQIFRNKVHSIYVTSVGIKHILKNINKTYQHFITFYFSIHGATDAKRERLIPSKDVFAKLSDIVDFTNLYGVDNKKIVWNYMVYDSNCTESDVNDFISLLKCINVKIDVRLTKYIRVESEINTTLHITEASEENFKLFVKTILSHQSEVPNINFRISKIEGETINVACGQMRAHYYE